MDFVLKLRELRRLRGLSQKDAARLSGVGEKTLSSFETGQRIDTMKVSQLQALLTIYDVTEETSSVTSSISSSTPPTCARAPAWRPSSSVSARCPSTSARVFSSGWSSCSTLWSSRFRALEQPAPPHSHLARARSRRTGRRRRR